MVKHIVLWLGGENVMSQKSLGGDNRSDLMNISFLDKI